ncbi:MAG: DNA-formamidopyrimidine glycosylase family protein, partial [Sphingomonas pseudosanguinis]|uniref:DNA-formamidopyrimidine glycosylase family protein n=1 Tax=Sphingomonas pseudosanguinis TaxID=413712 RepID=UPI00391B09CB
MPELPEVEVVRAGLEPAVAGALIASVDVRDERALTRHTGGAAHFEAELTGRRISAAVRRGKFLWMPVTDDEAIVTHLGMSGQMLLRTPGAPEERHERIRLELEHPVHGALSVVFADQRTFGSLAIDTLVDTPDRAPGGRGSDLASVPTQVAHIARDPLDPAFDAAWFRARLARTSSGMASQSSTPIWE